MSDASLLVAARQGDEDAFARLVEPYLRQLLTHCYRMLGSPVDAEDALQDALVDAWRGLPAFEGRSSLRSWLYTVATHACFKITRRRPARVLPIDYGGPADPHDPTGAPFIESVWLEPYADEALRYEERESVELAFVAALQHLPARQRAVLILRDVLGFSAREVADLLETSSVSIDSALQRAHQTVERRVPVPSQQSTLQALGEEELQKIVGRYVDAWERADVDLLVSMLTADVVLAMPPWREWYSGRSSVGAFLAAAPLRSGARWRVLPTSANGQLALALYDWDEGAQRFASHAITVLTLELSAIAEIAIFRVPELFPRFGLPEDLDPGETP